MQRLLVLAVLLAGALGMLVLLRSAPEIAEARLALVANETADRRDENRAELLAAAETLEVDHDLQISVPENRSFVSIVAQRSTEQDALLAANAGAEMLLNAYRDRLEEVRVEDAQADQFKNRRASAELDQAWGEIDAAIAIEAELIQQISGTPVEAQRTITAAAAAQHEVVQELQSLQVQPARVLAAAQVEAIAAAAPTAPIFDLLPARSSTLDLSRLSLFGLLFAIGALGMLAVWTPLRMAKT